MTVAAITMVKDEAGLIGWTLPRMAAQVDWVLVADNMSTDGTGNILHRLASDLGNVTIVADSDPAYLQSEKMTRLARSAREHGADFVVAFDADEVWIAPEGQRIADALERTPPHVALVYATLYDHVVTGVDDPAIDDPIQRIGWRRIEPLRLPKVACRTLSGLVIEQGNHGAHYPGAVTGMTALEVRHYPYRSPEQMTRKARTGAAAYRAAEGRTPPGAGAHWIEHDRLSDAQIAEVFETWYYSADPENDPTYVFDPCPLPMP